MRKCGLLGKMYLYKDICTHCRLCILFVGLHIDCYHLLRMDHSQQCLKMTIYWYTVYIFKSDITNVQDFLSDRSKHSVLDICRFKEDMLEDTKRVIKRTDIIMAKGNEQTMIYKYFTENWGSSKANTLIKWVNSECYEKGGSCCSTNITCCVVLVAYSVIRHGWRKWWWLRQTEHIRGHLWQIS